MRNQLQQIHESLCEKGYNPIVQLVGYILTEDPTYITDHNAARQLISRIDRNQLLYAILEDFFQNNSV